jgi:serine/threonine protein kinase
MVAADGGRIMEQTTFFEHYRICTNDDGSPGEVGRTGAAISYKAIDTRSNDPVLLQLIPLAAVDATKREKFEEHARAAQKLDHINIARIFAVGVDHEHFGLVSECLEGETADSWIGAHGPMPVDAVLRVGLEVIRAVAAAAFFSLTHRAIQPSNLMIVPGPSPDGGWPFVKLLNFGLAGMELHSVGTEAPAPAPSVAPQFASPEQLLGREADFRSEIYSLGATMWFLLTGAAPFAAEGRNAKSGARRRPELRGAPRSVQKLLARMLSESREERPPDPVTFEDELRDCLTNIEKHQAIRRRLGIPLATVTARKIREPRSSLAQVLAGAAAFAVLALAVTALGAYFYPRLVSVWHRTGKIGVLVGVPSASPAAPGKPVTGAPSIDDESIADSKSPKLPKAAPTIRQAEASTAQPAASPTAAAAAPGPAATTSTQIASSASAATEPASSSEGPGSTGSIAGEDAGTQAEENDSSSRSNTEPDVEPSARNHPGVHSRTKGTASTSSRATAPGRAPAVRPEPNEPGYQRRPRRGRWVRGRVVGVTRDGRLILRLPSGRIVTVRPRPEMEGTRVPPGYRPMYAPRPPMYPAPPWYPPGYPFND